MRDRSGFILFELLVSLAVFSALAVTTATIAQRTILRSQGISENEVLNRYLQRIRRPGGFERLDGMRAIQARKFGNGDKWKVFEYRPDGSEETYRLPVFLPAEENQQSDTGANESSF